MLYKIILQYMSELSGGNNTVAPAKPKKQGSVASRRPARGIKP